MNEITNIFKNDVAIGTERTNGVLWTWYNESISVTLNTTDVLQLKGKEDPDACGGLVQNFQLSYDYGYLADSWGDSQEYATYGNINYIDNTSFLRADNHSSGLSLVPNDYLHYWNFENSVKDENTTNLVDGTINGGVTYSSDNYNQSISVDGVSGSYVNLSYSTSMSGMEQLSIFVRVKPTGMVGGTSYPIFSNWRPSATDGRAFMIRFATSTTPWSIQVLLQNQSEQFNSVYTFADTNLSMDALHDIAMIYNGSAIILNIDGTNSTTVALHNGQLDIVTSPNTTFIGSSPHTPTLSWKGKIDDVFVFDRAITPAELTNIRTQVHTISGNISTPVMDLGNLQSLNAICLLNISTPASTNISIQVNTSSDNSSFSGLMNTTSLQGNCYAVNETVNRQRYYKINAYFTGNGTNTPTIGQMLAYSYNVSNSTTITYPNQYFISQRNSTDKGIIPIYGTYIGAPSAIEARFNGSDWVTINSSLSGGVFNGSLVASTGQGTLEVRQVDDATASDSETYISVGDIFVVTGQSNAGGRGENLSTLNGSNQFIAVNYKSNSWTIANDPLDANEGGAGSPYPLLAEFMMRNTSVPIGFITSAHGGVNITTYQKGNVNYDDLYSNIVSATNGTKNIKAVLFYQGETDALIGYGGFDGNYTLYYNNLTAFTSSIKADFNVSTFVAGIGQISGSYAPNVTRSSIDNIREAQVDSWYNNSNVSYGVLTYDMNLSDGIHIKTDEQLDTLSWRWWRAINNSLYGGTIGNYSRVTSIYINGNSLNITFDKPIFIKNSSRNVQGLYIQSSLGILNDSNVTSSNTVGNQLNIVFDTLIPDGNLSLNSMNDGTGVNSLIDAYGDPVEPTYNYVFSADIFPPASITSPSTATGNFYINNTWTNPIDSDFSHVMFKYANGTIIQNVSSPQNYLNRTWLAHYVQNISAQTVDTSDNINETLVWFNTTIPNNPISLNNVSATYSLIEGDTLSIIGAYTDLDGDTPTFGTNATKGTFNTSTGNLTWATVVGDAGTYNWYNNVTDGYNVDTVNYVVTVSSASKPRSYVVWID